MELTNEMKNSVPFQYAYGVKNGSIKTGSKIKLAVDRFFQWLDEAPENGFNLNHSSGMFVINFFQNFLNHTEGKLAGQPFVLAPFQQFTIYNVFGWLDKNGVRRIKTVYDKRAKKNGKTAEMAGISLFMASVDGEMRSQVYIGATKEEQAKLCWEAAKNMVESVAANPKIKQLGFRCLQKKILFQPTNSFIMALGGDSKTQDGINAHCSIIDEYHAHATDGVKENLESSSVQRVQPITWHITTAGTNLKSVCKNYEDSVIEVLQGLKKDDSLWIMIHDLDDGDDWENPENWYKANPLLGQGLNMERLMEEYQKAVNQPSKAPNFKTKHLNMWVDAPNVWITREMWKKNKATFSVDVFQKYGSFAACDLSTTTDITALTIVSNATEDGTRYAKFFAFCPKATIEKRSKEDRVPYRYWMDQGYLIATEGDVVDYEVVKEYIVKTYYEYNVERVEFDKWNSSQVVSELMEKNINISYFSQSISNYSEPTKAFEKLVLQGKFLHDGNPLVEWCLSGCVKIEDNNENIRISKGKSHANGKRIDPIIAAIMALGGSISIDETNNSSVYNNPDNDFIC